MSGQPPIHVDVSERTFYGLTLRTGLILTLSGCVVMGLLLGEIGLPYYLRAGLAVTMAGLGLSCAYGQIQGRNPEVWLGEVLAFRRRRRYFVHGAQKHNDQLRVELPAEPKQTIKHWVWTFKRPTFPSFPMPRQARHKPVPFARVHNESRSAAASFFYLTANAIGLSLLTGLTLYLLQGGATRLLSLLRPF